MNNTESAIKVRPPFPAISAFPACSAVLSYYEPSATCLQVLKRLSKKTKRYAEAH